MNKTVVFIDNFPFAYLGGGETYILALANELDQLGYQLVFVAQASSAFAHEATQYSDHVLTVNFEKNTPFLIAKDIHEYLKEIDTSKGIIYQGAGFYSNVIASLCKTQSDALVFTQQIELERVAGSLSFKDKLNACVRGLVRRLIAPKVSAYLAVSSTLEEQLCSQSYIAKESVHVIHPALPLESYHARENLIEPLEELAQIKGYKIGFLGRLESVKNVDILIHAFALLKEKYAGEPLNLCIAGQGSKEHELIALVNSFDKELASSIHFLNYQDSARFMKSIDLFCMPSKSEGLNIAVLQAHAFKMPVVASNVGALTHTVKHELRGILCEANDVQALYHALEYAYTHSSEMQAYANAACEYVNKNFNDANLKHQVQTFYNAL